MIDEIIFRLLIISFLTYIKVGVYFSSPLMLVLTMKLYLISCWMNGFSPQYFRLDHIKCFSPWIINCHNRSKGLKHACMVKYLFLWFWPSFWAENMLDTHPKRIRDMWSISGPSVQLRLKLNSAKHRSAEVQPTHRYLKTEQVITV